jgi:hypothetical protein
VRERDLIIIPVVTEETFSRLCFIFPFSNKYLLKSRNPRFNPMKVSSILVAREIGFRTIILLVMFAHNGDHPFDNRTS